MVPYDAGDHFLANFSIIHYSITILFLGKLQKLCFHNCDVILFLAELQKPWRVKAPKLSSDASKVEENAKPDSSQNEFDDEVKRVDNLLKQARHIRGEQKEQRSVEQSQNQIGKKQTRNQGSSSAKPQKLNVKTPAKSDFSGVNKKAILRSEKALFSKQKTTRPCPGVEKPPDAIPSTSQSNEKSGQGDDNYIYVDMAEALKHLSLPSKYTKLCRMHENLANVVGFAEYSTLPGPSELKFISKLNGVNPESVTNTSQLKPRLSISAIKMCLSKEVQRCQSLIDILVYKTSYSCSNATPASMYYEKLVLSKIMEKITDLENSFQILKETIVIDPDNQKDENIVAACERRASSHNIACSSLSYKNTDEIIRNTNLHCELFALHLKLALKKQIHEVFTNILHEEIKRQESDRGNGISQDVATYLTTAYGLLAKTHRCAINPAVVKCD